VFPIRGRAAADGYTLLLVTVTNAFNATLYDKLNFNFIRDIAPVAGLMRVPNVMLVNPSVPAKTIPEFIAYAKAKSGQDQHGVRRRRRLDPCVGRAVQHDGGRQYDSRAISRGSARAHRSARRASAGNVRLHALVDRIHQGRQAARWP
jgi:hypothetical protein